MKKSFFFRRLFLLTLFAVISLTSQTRAAEFHVTDAAGFQNALNTAETNGQDDIIYLAAGTYHGGFPYSPPGTEHKSLTIRGEPGTSAEEIILDGQNSARVLDIYDMSEGSLVDLVIDGITVQNGYAPYHSGGIFAGMNQFNITITNCIIRNNRGASQGSGVLMENDSHTAGVLTLENNLISDNTVTEVSASSDGGGVLMWNSYGIHIIRNNIIARNTAQGTSSRGGGLWVGHSTPQVAHLIGNTIYGNQANEGGGIYLNFGEIVNVYNNIIYGNTASEGEDIYFRDVDISNGYNNNYSNMFGTWTASGNNLNTDPLFVDPANDDFRLQSASPMINAGTSSVPSPPGLPSTDYEGNPRVCGPALDIGAYETRQIYPDQGTIGTRIEIPGSGYGTRKNKVLLGTIPLKILEWNDNLIRASLTKVLTPGAYDITIQPKGSSSILLEDAFTVMAPEIESVNPTSGSAGDEITIYGSFFGMKKGKVRLGEKNCRVKTWTMDAVTGESEIHFVVPKGLAVGTHELRVTNGMGSDTSDFGVD